MFAAFFLYKLHKEFFIAVISIFIIFFSLVSVVGMRCIEGCAPLRAHRYFFILHYEQPYVRLPLSYSVRQAIFSTYFILSPSAGLSAGMPFCFTPRFSRFRACSFLFPGTCVACLVLFAAASFSLWALRRADLLSFWAYIASMRWRLFESVRGDASFESASAHY